MLIMDGVRYLPHDYDNEDELEQMVVEHAKDIFGENSMFFPIKQSIKTRTGVKSVPDGYMIDFDKGRFYIIEIELSSHPEYDHINKQIGKFIQALKSHRTRQKIARVMRDYVNGNIVRQKFVTERIGSSDVYQYFLEDILEEVPNQEYETIIVIDEETDKIKDACSILKPEPRILEFKTFVRENTGPEVHIHSFEPLLEAKPRRKPPKVPKKRKKTDAVPQGAFRIPILAALMEMDGKGFAKDVLNEVERKIKSKLGEADYQKLDTGGIRWRNRAMWERNKMVREGLLRDDSPRGLWEITKKGRGFFRSRTTKELVLKDFQK
ncbi:MAG: winged helix-turn-helix domain-containing protein [Thermoplasmata archaeon]|nr:winged helix-turn-helix domain-containing protein [Thermoplasmata archaeon]